MIKRTLAIGAVLLATQTWANDVLPPKPTNAVMLAEWQRLVAVPRQAHPWAIPTNIYNEPAISPDSVAATSHNWSGFVDTVTSGAFKVNNSEVFQRWVVPEAKVAPGSCHFNRASASQWAGFDGWHGTNDVLQAGTQVTDFCAKGKDYPTYSTFYEWYPGPEFTTSVPAKAGDMMEVSVWYTVATPHGRALIANFTQNQAALFVFDQPPDANFVGASAEWIMERPSINGTMENLDDYGVDHFSYIYAKAGAKDYYLDANSLAVTMLCPPWTPSTACPTRTAISVPTMTDARTFYMTNEGPSK